MKAITLSVNAMVIIAIAILIMASIAAIFTLWYSDSTNTIKDAEAIQQGCRQIQSMGCDPSFTPEEKSKAILSVNIPNYYPGGIKKVNKDNPMLIACKRILYGSDPSEIDKNIKEKCYNYCCGITN